eukprot:15451241-Alexandrium_andersonii.AAC.1
MEMIGYPVVEQAKGYKCAWAKCLRTMPSSPVKSMAGSGMHMSSISPTILYLLLFAIPENHALPGAEAKPSKDSQSTKA